MMSNLTPVMIWAATYFLHSSLLLGGVWCWFRWREPASHAFRETVWKLAVAGGFVTASLQLGLSIESPVNTALRTAWTVPSTVSREVPAMSAEPEPFLPDTNATLVRTGQTWAREATHADLTLPAELPEFDHTEQTQFSVYDPGDDMPATQLIGTTAAENFPVENVAAELKTAETDSPALASVASPSSDLAKFGTGLYFALAGIVIAIGGVLMAFSGWGLYRLLAEHSEFRHRLAGCGVISSGKSREILDELLQQARVRRSVTLLKGDDDLEPGACGWLQWKIVVPGRAIDELGPRELRALLAHELAHLVRGDQWWLLMGRLLAVCFAWQPLNRVALREWQRASEYLCDAWAIQRDVERISLARCLTTVAEWRLVGMASIAGLGSGNSSNLTGRVERLIDDGSLADSWLRQSRRNFLAGMSLVVAIGMVSYAPAATLSSPPISTQDELAQETGLDRQVNRATDLPQQATDSPRGTTFFVADAQLQPTLSVPMDAFSQTSPLAVAREPNLVIEFEVIRTLHQEVSLEMSELSAELGALEVTISQLPLEAQGARWQSQLQRFRQRVTHMQRLREALLIPM